MEIQDKRILQQKPLSEQESYIKKLPKSTPNADNKYEHIDVDHEPIGLINKLKNAERQIREPSSAGLTDHAESDSESADKIEDAHRTDDIPEGDTGE